MAIEETPQITVNGERIPEYEFDMLWAAPAQANSNHITSPTVQTATYAPRGKFYQDKYIPPEVGRKGYLNALQDEAVTTNYRQYAPLTSRRITHVDRNGSLNFYTEEMRRAVPIFLHYYGKGELVVINGFRSHWEIGIQAHSVGIAMDIQATTEQATRIMNAAYMAGIPTILPGGDFLAGEGYVHLDLAEKPPYTYEAGYYEGPWSK